MKHPFFNIASKLFLVFLFGCGAANNQRTIHDKASFLANNIDTSSLALLRHYSYIQRGPIEFWNRHFEGTTKYTFRSRKKGDTDELIISKPFEFRKEFPTTFQFDTSYYQYSFVRVGDSIVRFTRTNFDGLRDFKDSIVAAKNVFPKQDPFDRIKELNEIKDKYGFIDSWHLSDIGDYIVFWFTPYDKLIYMPDSNQMNQKFKRFWIDEFLTGERIKEHWSLVKIKTTE